MNALSFNINEEQIHHLNRSRRDIKEKTHGPYGIMQSSKYAGAVILKKYFPEFLFQ